MAKHLDWESIKQNSMNLMSDIRGGVETMVLSKNIKKEMEEGASLAEILHKHLPTVDLEVIQEDAASLEKGVGKVYKAKDEEVDASWVKSHLNDRMADMDEKERVTFLSNLITAERAMHPDIELEEEALELMESLKTAEACTAEDVDVLVNLANSVLKEHAGMLTQISWKAMEKRMHKLDHELIEENIGFGEEVSIAYAAACYIQQQCGKAVKMNKEDKTDLPTELLGSAAAASVESSYLMQQYCRGRITKKVFFDKLERLYTAVLTFVCEHKIGVAVQAVLTVVVFVALFSLISEILYISPILRILGAAVISVWITTQGITTKDIEDALNAVWDAATNIWENIKSAYKKTIAGFKGNADADVEEDIVDTEFAEDATEETAEFDFESENEEENEEEDEDEAGYEAVY